MDTHTFELGPVVDAETGEALALNSKSAFSARVGGKSKALVSSEEKWKRPFHLDPAKTRNELVAKFTNLQRRNHEYLAQVIEEESEAEKKRAMQWRLEKDPRTRKLLKEKFGRERMEARERIERIRDENEMALASKLVETNLLR